MGGGSSSTAGNGVSETNAQLVRACGEEKSRTVPVRSRGESAGTMVDTSVNADEGRTEESVLRMADSKGGFTEEADEVDKTDERLASVSIEWNAGEINTGDC
jgi:hypothetical protein